METSRTLTIDVDGLPGPQGSKSFKGFSKKGRAILTESSKKVKPWRAEVVKAARAAMIDQDWPITTESVSVQMTFWLRRPLSAPKRSRLFHRTYPDLSKLVRATEDALTTAGVWKDDALIMREQTDKRYAVSSSLTAIYRDDDHEEPGALIVVTTLGFIED